LNSSGNLARESLANGIKGLKDLRVGLRLILDDENTAQSAIFLETNVISRIFCDLSNGFVQPWSCCSTLLRLAIIGLGGVNEYLRVNVKELKDLLVLELSSFEGDGLAFRFNDEQSWEFFNFVFLSQRLLALPDQAEIQSLLEILAESLIHEGSSLLGVGEQKNFGSAWVFLDESLVIILSDLDRLVCVEFSSELSYTQCIEISTQIEIRSRCWEGRVKLKNWSGLNLLLLADLLKVIAVNGPNSENPHVITGELFILLDHLIDIVI